VVVAAVVLLLVAATVLLLRRKAARRERRLLDAFGRPPQGEPGTLDSIRTYHHYCEQTVPAGNRIDATTWDDLNMDEVFLRIDACASSGGEEYLYHQLHELQTGPAPLKAFERIVRWAEECPQERLRAQKILAAVGKMPHNGLGGFLFEARAKKNRFYSLCPLLALLPLLGALAAILFGPVGLLFMGVAMAANIVIYWVNLLALEQEFHSLRYLSAMLRGAGRLQKSLGSRLQALGMDLKAPLKEIGHLRGLIPGKASGLLAELEGLIVVFKAIFLVDLVLYNRTVNAILRHTEPLCRIYEALGRVDSAISVASLRRSLAVWCMPEFIGETAIRFTDACHPLIARPVPNSAQLNGDCIITGSNASGKSTFIKTVAVNHILAQTIHTCCARSYALRFCHVASSMAVRDDLLAGESYFVAEVRSLKRLIDLCRSRPCLCLIDEILRGTNTPERIAASTAVLTDLHCLPNSLIMVASHDIELTRILEGVYDNYHFSETFSDDGVEFDYILKKGPSRTTNAIRLLKYMGFDAEIVADAARRVKEY